MDGWWTAWEAHILRAAERRYCDREMGEEIGWLVSPFLGGFYHAHRASGDPAWVERFVDWAEAWVRRGVEEPDGHIGWPKAAGASTTAVPPLYTDNLLGEAMALRWLALMAADLRDAPAHRDRARGYLDLNRRIFGKWDRRGCWREVADGGLWVVPPFGIDPATGGWTDGYAERESGGFSMPANKQNHIALWLLALHDATGEAVYRERAAKWWRLMKARIRQRDGYCVWNYWDPAGPWDFRPDGAPRHWIGVHPNGGYYSIDVEGMAAAHGHGLVFDAEDIARLVATNRDFMWNGQVEGARFQRIDGGPPDERWKDTPGCLWWALVPHDATLRRIFEANHRPDSWGGLTVTPWWLAAATR